MESGESQANVAKAMGVHKNTVYKVYKAYKERGTTDDTPAFMALTTSYTLSHRHMDHPVNQYICS